MITKISQTQRLRLCRPRRRRAPEYRSLSVAVEVMGRYHTGSADAPTHVALRHVWRCPTLEQQVVQVRGAGGGAGSLAVAARPRRDHSDGDRTHVRSTPPAGFGPAGESLTDSSPGCAHQRCQRVPAVAATTSRGNACGPRGADTGWQRRPRPPRRHRKPPVISPW